MTEVRPAAFAVLLRPCLHRLNDSELRQLTASFWLQTAFNIGSERAAKGSFLPEDRDREDLAVYPYAVLAFLKDPGTQFPPTAQQRTDLVIDAIDACAEGILLSDEASREITKELLIQAPGASVRLSGWLQSYGHRVSGTGIRDAVISGPADVALLETAMSLDPSSPDAEAISAAAQLRMWMLDQGQLPESRRYEATVQRALQLPGLFADSVAPDLLSALDAGVALAQSFREKWVEQSQAVVEVLHRAPGHEAATTAVLHQMSVQGAVFPTWALAQAFVGHVTASRTRATVLAEIIIGTSVDPQLDADRLRDASWRLVKNFPADAAEHFFNTYSRAANGWLREHNPSSSGSRWSSTS